MSTFDSVPPDTPGVIALPARLVRYQQTLGPFVLHGLATLFYIASLLQVHSGHGLHKSKVLTLLAVLAVLIASFLRRVSLFLVSEIGSYRYDRVGSTVTRLLPNTRQSWIAVLTLAAVAIGVPLYMYLFTHYTARHNVYGFAMFGLGQGLGAPFVAFAIGLLLCVAVMGAAFGLVQLPLGGRNPFYVPEQQDRLRGWIRMVSWFPLTTALLILFVFSRLLMCGGPLGRYAAYGRTDSCGSGMHFIAGLFAWFVISLAYICLDIGQAYVRRLGGGPVSYYALEPRLDGFFSELLVWTLKVTAALVTFVDPIGANIVAALLFAGLFAFTFVRRTSTIEALESLTRGSLLVVAVFCVVSASLTARRIPAAVVGCVLLFSWLAAAGVAVYLHWRSFALDIFSVGRDVTADILLV